MSENKENQNSVKDNAEISKILEKIKQFTIALRDRINKELNS
jgi:hypothetical protein